MFGDCLYRTLYALIMYSQFTTVNFIANYTGQNYQNSAS